MIMGNKSIYQEHFFNQLAKDKRFIAYYLHRHLELEKQAKADLMKSLDCDAESLFKLGGCIAPSPQDGSFRSRISKIALFAGVDPSALENLVRRVSVLDKFAETDKGANSSQLLAARDKSSEE